MLPFSSEDPNTQGKILMSWITGEIPAAHSKRTDILVPLQKMQFNEYNRLFDEEEVDLSVLIPFLTEKAYCDLLEFKRLHINDHWYCQKCKKRLPPKKIVMCQRCLFWYHKKCFITPPNVLKASNYDICTRCRSS